MEGFGKPGDGMYTRDTPSQKKILARDRLIFLGLVDETKTYPIIESALRALRHCDDPDIWMIAHCLDGAHLRQWLIKEELRENLEFLAERYPEHRGIQLTYKLMMTAMSNHLDTRILADWSQVMSSHGLAEDLGYQGKVPKN